MAHAWVDAWVDTQEGRDFFPTFGDGILNLLTGKNWEELPGPYEYGSLLFEGETRQCADK